MTDTDYLFAQHADGNITARALFKQLRDNNDPWVEKVLDAEDQERTVSDIHVVTIDGPNGKPYKVLGTIEVTWEDGRKSYNYPHAEDFMHSLAIALDRLGHEDLGDELVRVANKIADLREELGGA